MLVARSFTAVLLLVAASVPAFGKQPSLEYDVKAAFVLNFARYVEWPLDLRQPPLRMCVLQPNPFGNRLEAAVAGEQWHGGAIDVRIVADARRAAECHLLYVPLAATDRFVTAFADLAGRPVLIVGEHPRFLEQGGMIRLFVEENRVRFSVNQGLAQSAHLEVSSRLLRLARAVIGAPGAL
jgi:hypothetical protein